ncbi:MAG: 2-C-methyl-D-erythritol 4-phosphate cytidylyltransferase [Gammaproteobacteria bacterium]|nr:MAG: 2-C-methyl-D-erythritol 4-phosphate cytidylyltransferase [Gammaproteobacteria bacterium]
MRLWAIVPAAGIGRRMGTEVPKQYLPLLGRPVIAHTLAALDRLEALEGILVAVREDDAWWPEVERGLATRAPLVRVPGGRERRDSVANALRRLRDTAAPDDWVLVHDAVRPCLDEADLRRLVARACNDPVGALLAAPVRDTMKEADGEGRSARTLDRSRLWHALTPQMFRLGLLEAALRRALAEGLPVTDEAAALEHAGHRPLLVEGRSDNLKITRPEDLALAEFHLRRRAAS